MARKRIGVLTYERLTQFLLTNVYFGLESYYDIHKVPENYTWFLGTTRANTPQLDLSPETVQLFNSLGDVLEISVGSGIVRFSLAVVEEVVKSEPIKAVVRNIMKHERLKYLVEKTVGIEKSNKLAVNGEIEMSDDTQFWAALVPWTIVKAAHSLGLISLGAHDHIGAPVPHMLIGQAFAVASIIGTHYGTKNAEEIIQLTSKLFTKIKENTVAVAGNIETNLYMAKYGVEDTLQKAGLAMNNFDNVIGGWIDKLQRFDPNKVIPSADAIWEKLLGERVWNALGRQAVEHVVDQDEIV